MWFHYMDMHSGGGTKTPYEHIFIQETDQEHADAKFQQVLGRDPDYATCPVCCGRDFSKYDGKTLLAVARYFRKSVADFHKKSLIVFFGPVN